ncbi:hypothetical protein BGZ94_004623 [Podila epigama]|nr:hypothetical protein BGZ94_004623 [Podila epigama]
MEPNNEPWSQLATDVLLDIDWSMPDEAYYGPYNSILHEVFSPADHYLVVPRPHRDGRDAVEYTIEYLVTFKRQVVVFIDIKRENILPYEYACSEADLYLRDNFRSMHNSLSLTETVGISIFGRFCRVYWYNRETRQITTNGGDDIAAKWWDIDLHTLPGRLQLAGVFAETRKNVNQELAQH